MTIAIVAMGEMGCGVSQSLVENGARVVTSLVGRSPASAQRAAEAGAEVVNDDGALVAQADFIFSIVPPARAADFAQRMLPHIRAIERKPVFVDCNAVAPATLQQIAAPFQAERLPFVDASIIGRPPAPGRKPPRFYVSGENLDRVCELRKLAVDVRPLSSRLGDASALKMANAGVNKGLQALGTAMILGAARNGVAQALFQEMRYSQGPILELLESALPRMYAKAYRWTGEMVEIAKFLQAETGGSQIFQGAAQLYEDIAQDFAIGPDHERIALVKSFLAQGAKQK